MSENKNGCDDHHWEVIAQRQFLHLVTWLHNFVDPEFRKRVWQEGTGIGQFYEETAAQFEDLNIEWLLEDGLPRLGASPVLLDAIHAFDAHYCNFDSALPPWVDAVQLESNPTFLSVVTEAKVLLATIDRYLDHIRTVADGIPPYR